LDNVDGVSASGLLGAETWKERMAHFHGSLMQTAEMTRGGVDTEENESPDPRNIQSLGVLAPQDLGAESTDELDKPEILSLSFLKVLHFFNTCG
jgi:hypothetical protein